MGPSESHFLTISTIDTALLQYQDILRLHVPSNEHVGLLQSWLDKEQPLDDEGKRYLANTEPRGVWERQHLKFTREPRELASLDKQYDSFLARIVRRTPLGLFYLVSEILILSMNAYLLHRTLTRCAL